MFTTFNTFPKQKQTKDTYKTSYQPFVTTRIPNINNFLIVISFFVCSLKMIDKELCC